MPHKHTRKTRDRDESTYDLPPSAIARPLPVSKKSRKAVQQAQVNSNSNNGKGRAKSRKTPKSEHDDTPKAFVRLMRYQSAGKRPHGLDNGDTIPESKKRKLQKASVSDSGPINAADSGHHSTDVATSGQQDALKIQRGESLSEFSARVNQALPVSGLARTAKQLRSAGLGNLVKERQTKRERRIQKMQEEWRTEDAKRKDREEEARDEAEAENEEIWGVEGRMDGKDGGTVGKANDDPWAELKNKREQRGGLHDVVQAPPQFTRTPKELLKTKNGAHVDVANVPTSAGSLKRREELGSARRDIIQRYREMMQKQRSEGK